MRKVRVFFSCVLLSLVVLLFCKSRLPLQGEETEALHQHELEYDEETKAMEAETPLIVYIQSELESST